MPEWQSMESAPRDGSPFLACFMGRTGSKHVIVRYDEATEDKWRICKCTNGQVITAKEARIHSWWTGDLPELPVP